MAPPEPDFTNHGVSYRRCLKQIGRRLIQRSIAVDARIVFEPRTHHGSRPRSHVRGAGLPQAHSSHPICPFCDPTESPRDQNALMATAGLEVRRTCTARGHLATQCIPSGKTCLGNNSWGKSSRITHVCTRVLRQVESCPGLPSRVRDHPTSNVICSPPVYPQRVKPKNRCLLINLCRSRNCFVGWYLLSY